MDITQIVTINTKANLAKTSIIKLPKYKKSQGTTLNNSKAINATKVESPTTVKEIINEVRLPVIQQLQPPLLAKTEPTNSIFPPANKNISLSKVIGWVFLIGFGTFVVIKIIDFAYSKSKPEENNSEVN